MFLTVSLILAVIVVAYIVAQSRLKLSVELAMLVATLVGAVVAGNYLPLRHIAEGSVTYLDLALIFFTATLFMNIIKASGGLDFTVRAIMTRFGNRRAIALILLMFIMLIPGAITGAAASPCWCRAAQWPWPGHMGISKQRSRDRVPPCRPFRGCTPVSVC